MPNVFGKQILYISGSGIQVYMYKADWPQLQIGDLIKITGILTESQGERRIKLSSAEDITIIEHQEPPSPKTITALQIGEDFEGHLVQIAGQLIEKSGSHFYLQDETGEADVYIKTNTKIKKTDFQEGDQLKITGIVTQNNDGYQLLPRSLTDLEKTLAINQTSTSNLETKNTSRQIFYYLLGTAFFLITSLIFFLIIKKRKSQPKLQSQN